MKKSVDGDTKLSFVEILFSPVLSWWNMAKSQEDIEPELDLDLNSSDQLVAELAESQKEIDTKVENFGGSGKAQRREMLNKTKVDKKDLKQVKREEPQATKQVEKEDRER